MEGGRKGGWRDGGSEKEGLEVIIYVALLKVCCQTNLRRE